MQLPDVKMSATENSLALALVVVINWMLAHLFTQWVMPSEVQSALQTVITILIAWFITRTNGNGNGKKTNGTPPSPPEGPKP